MEPAGVDAEFFTCRVDRTSAGAPLAPDLGVLQERHAERELLLVLSGGTEFSLDGKMFRAVPGTAFFIDSWVAHKQNYLPREVCCRHYWVHLHEKRLFGGLLEMDEQGGRSFHSTTEFSPELAALLRQRWLLLERDGVAAELRKLLQTTILRAIFDELALRRFQPPATRPTYEVVAAVCQYIIINHGRNFARHELEKLSGYTAHHLMRVFKQQTGLTIGEYINQVRRGHVAVATAKGLTQKEIAGQLGFSSPAAFWLWKHRSRGGRGDA